MERRLSAILSADVVGYSRLMGEDEAGTLAALKKHRKELIAPKEAQYNGRTIKLMGDGALMEFGSVVDAVLFAIEVQCLMRERNAAVREDRRIVYRIGINIGDIIVEGDDIYGDGVNVAARLESLADPGGVCVSRTVFNHVKGKVDLDFEDLGEQEVKNITEPVSVYRAILDDKAAALATPVRSAAPAKKNRRFPAAVAAGVFLAVVGGVIWWQNRTAELEPAKVERMALPLPDNPSVAILPFDNMSGNVEQNYFADGITEDLITDLSKVPGVFVIARNSTFAYKGKAVKVGQVAEELGVRYIVEGSVRRASDKVRVNAQLIDAISGYHVWADRYDGSLSDIFALQDQVVEQIVSALALNIKSSQAGELAPVETEIVEAYDEFLEGWDLYRRQTPEDTLAAIGHFERAVELDPDYSRAYAGLAASYWLIAEVGRWSEAVGILWQDTFDLARKYLLKALERPTSTAHLVAASILRFEGKTEEALAEIDKAIALEPNNPDSYVSKAQALIFVGRPEEAEQSARLAMRMNPHYEPGYLQALGRAVFYQGRYEEAARILERIVKRQPERQETYLRLAASYGQLGRLEDARAAVDEYNAISAKTNYTPLTVQEAALWHENTMNFKDRRIAEPLFEGLRKAGVPEGAAPERDGFDFKALVTSSYDQDGRSFVVEGVAKLDAAGVKEKLEEGVVVIDVRDAGNYGNGHVPGAVNLDLNLALTEENLTAIVEKDEPVIFHCWGASCSYSAMACAKALLWGFNEIYYFSGGFPAWKAAGYPVEKGGDGS